MSSTQPAADVKPKKSRKPKADAPVTESKDADVSAGSEKTKATRRPRFNPYVPSNFFNLQEVWNYRTSQRRGLQKMKVRVENAKDEAEREKLKVNVRRNEQNLNQLKEHLNDVRAHVALAGELLKAGVKVDSTTSALLSGFVGKLTESLNAREQAASASESD
jgi:hypothetical protein